MRRRRRSTVQHCPALALLLLIDTTGMIIGALQQSPFIPANTGGEAKEPGSDGAFAALLLAVAVLLQSDSVVSTAQPAEGDSLAAAAPAAGEDGAPPAPSSAQDETASPAAASPILGPAPAVFPAPIADTNSPAPAVPLAPANSPALAVRAPVDEKVAGAPPPPSEAAAVIAAPAPQPSDPKARRWRPAWRKRRRKSPTILGILRLRIRAASRRKRPRSPQRREPSPLKK